MPDETTAKAGEGTPTSQASAADPTAGSKKVEYSPEQQAHLDDLLKREKKSWEKSVKEQLEKAAKYDELQKKQQESEEAAKSELQKLQENNTRLLAETERGKRLQEIIEDILAAKLEAIPEDKKSLIEALPENMSPEDKLKWIEKNHTLLFGKSASIAFAPAGGKPATGATDPERERAIGILKMTYPPNHAIWKDTAKLEAKIAENIERIKKQPRPASSQ